MSIAKTTSSAALDEPSLGRIVERPAPGDDDVAAWARDQALQELQMIVRRIWRRARSRTLDRGLTLSLPYFDDAAMEIRQLEMEVIPRGRIMFVPAFIVLAARREMQRVAAAAEMTEGTKRHLIVLLETLEREFGGPADETGRQPGE